MGFNYSNKMKQLKGGFQQRMLFCVLRNVLNRTGNPLFKKQRKNNLQFFTNGKMHFSILSLLFQNWINKDLVLYYSRTVFVGLT